MMVEAVEVTIASLEMDGRISAESEAVVTMARALAIAVDERPNDAPLWREMRQALAALSLVGADRGDDDTTDFFASIRVPPPVGDPPDD